MRAISGVVLSTLVAGVLAMPSISASMEPSSHFLPIGSRYSSSAYTTAAQQQPAVSPAQTTTNNGRAETEKRPEYWFDKTYDPAARTAQQDAGARNANYSGPPVRHGRAQLVNAQELFSPQEPEFVPPTELYTESAPARTDVRPAEDVPQRLPPGDESGLYSFSEPKFSTASETLPPPSGSAQVSSAPATSTMVPAYTPVDETVNVSDMARQQRFSSLGQLPMEGVSKPRKPLKSALKRSKSAMKAPVEVFSDSCEVFSDCEAPLGCGCPKMFCFTATPLFWTTHRPTNPYTATTNQGFDTDEITYADAHNVQFDDDVGYRLAASYYGPYGWDVTGRYTNFHNSGFGSLDDSSARLLPLHAHPAFVSNSELTEGLDYAESRLDIDYDVVDIELGKNFLFYDNTVAARAFGGFRYGHVEQQVASRYEVSSGGLTDVDTVIMNTDTHAFGGRVGGQLAWTPYGGFGLFSRGALSILRGDFSTNRLETLTQEINQVSTGSINFSNNFEDVIPVTELALGVQYQYCWFKIAVGYEFQTWFNMVNDPRFVKDTIVRREQVLIFDRGNLSFDGFFLDASFCY